MADSFSSFEKKVLLEACSQDPSSEIALKQFASAVFQRRDRTTQGMFVRFEVANNVGSIEKSYGRILLGSKRISLKHPKLSQGADVIVWLHCGRIDCLETYVFADEPWPVDDEDAFEFEYWPAE